MAIRSNGEGKDICSGKKMGPGGRPRNFPHLSYRSSSCPWKRGVSPAIAPSMAAQRPRDFFFFFFPAGWKHKTLTRVCYGSQAGGLSIVLIVLFSFSFRGCGWRPVEPSWSLVSAGLEKPARILPLSLKTRKSGSQAWGGRRDDGPTTWTCAWKHSRQRLLGISISE